MQLTNLQLELLKTFSYDLSESQLLEIKDLLSKYFAQKTPDEMKKFWDENNWLDETIEKIANEYLRTEYRNESL